MKIAIIGTGYVGLVSGACFADMGNDVVCVDNNIKKIENLKNGILPIYEPGLKEIIQQNSKEGRLLFTDDMAEGIKDALFVFICVGTPPASDGSADLSFVLSCAREIGKNLDSYKIIINKSTVPVGTAEKVRQTIYDKLFKRERTDIKFDVVSNPEFLKEGSAIEDFIKPDRIIIGSDSTRAIEYMENLYSPFCKQNDRIKIMDIASAELTKYAANAMLATRISFMNELSRVCEAVEADIEHVRAGIGSDSRIGHAFLYAGLGYGGSCFPKDVKALISTASNFNIGMPILNAVEKVNAYQRILFTKKIKEKMGPCLPEIVFAVWGMAFKPNTDDMRDAPAVSTINALRERGAKFQVYDPIAIDNAQKIFGNDNITYVHNEYDVLNNADALIIFTDCHQFREPDFNKMKSLMNKPIIFDGRNQYNPSTMKELGFQYFCIGR
jgi:UDPglucose 6-dehydrogenase